LPVGRRARQGIGNADAFAERVRPHLPRLYRYALRLCRDRDAAADIAQDGVLKAFENVERYDPSRPILPWLLALVRNTFIDRTRAFDPLRAAADAEDESVHHRTAPDPADKVSGAERAARVDEALARLPLEQRSCVVLYHVEGLTLEEIAAAEGVPVGTVKSRLHRGRAAMAEMLADVVKEL
jgi:RNA polymerase sigma-70 factor (ECF subfamily)